MFGAMIDRSLTGWWIHPFDVEGSVVLVRFSLSLSLCVCDFFFFFISMAGDGAVSKSGLCMKYSFVPIGIYLLSTLSPQPLRKYTPRERMRERTRAREKCRAYRLETTVFLIIPLYSVEL